MMKTKFELEMYQSGMNDFHLLATIRHCIEGFYQAGRLFARMDFPIDAAEMFDIIIHFRESEAYKNMSEEEKFFEEECWYDRITDTYVCLAEAEYMLGDFPACIQSCNKHLEMAEKYGKPALRCYVILAYAYGFGLEDVDEAFFIFETYIQKFEEELNPQVKILYKERAHFFSLLGMDEEAEKDLETCQNIHFY
jgi:tetratricopeptide (TPR) repeat protein